MAKILSIEIDNRNVKILEGAKKGSSISVNKSIFLEIQPNSIDDGKITDMDSVAGVIQKALINNNVKTKKAIFTINSNSIITRSIELPVLKKKSQTMSMIKNELEQLLSVDLNEYKLIYKIEGKAEIETQNCKYIVYGLPIDIYNDYIELAMKLKLAMVSLDLSFNSLDEISDNKISINGKSLKETSSTAFIDFGYNNITFSVVNSGKNDFSRISSNGINDIVRSLVTVYNLTQEMALTSIGELSLTDEVENISDISKLNIAEDSIGLWIDEFNRYIRYYNSNNKDKQIEKIFIYGSFANINGLEEYLGSRLNIEVEEIKNVSGLILKDNISDFNVKKYFNTLLSFYISRKDINFLTDKNKEHKSKFNVGVFVMVVTVVAALTASYYLYSYMVRQKALEKELQTINQFMESEENIQQSIEAESLKSKALLLEKYKQEVEKLQQSISNQDAVTTIMFEEIGKAVPLGTKINSMIIDKQSIQLQCSSGSKLEVAQLEKNLKNIEFINYVYIPAVVEGANGSNANYSYSVVCEVKDVSADEAE